ncbi:MazG nucleotide pyrophosphohydrolase domain-containing protein [Corynebacterium liangguodongii]|uniref:Nucleoside triphosphate hydrolase n=1 Tax=Corynebacterium liangguodongii TaxID=2079535 RepID=A0A2S0WFK5_9CORY|nr:MazG nucleotide pyrophosphohydrolase domain-containing protein [Corynebacterium liangguodongii]AWB84452.1 nucleoside triphosphate hydrolase [Corynebacterium liangguodongii]PWB99941.1 nucleoside triphosphate hydrolase [Corynebacterium liangguodongii]
MTVLVLDPRWPDMIPLDVVGKIRGKVEYTSEVPVRVRWALEAGPGEGEWLVTTDEGDGDVVKRVRAGEDVIVASSLADPMFQAAETMRRARARGEWERAMTHESLLPYLTEEAGEFAEAVRSGAGSRELKRELSDVFLQVLFHAEIATDFDLADVAAAFVDKMRSRAPYLFDGTTGLVAKDEQDRLWAEGKAREG